jgi:hypothetical protein
MRIKCNHRYTNPAPRLRHEYGGSGRTETKKKGGLFSFLSTSPRHTGHDHACSFPRSFSLRVCGIGFEGDCPRLVSKRRGWVLTSVSTAWPRCAGTSTAASTIPSSPSTSCIHSGPDSSTSSRYGSRKRPPLRSILASLKLRFPEYCHK